MAWSPLRGGLLTGRYLDKSKIGEGDRLFDEGRLDRELTEPVHKKLLKLKALARKWGMSLVQLVIAYMLHLPGMGPAIPSCSAPEQLEENAKAGKIKLEEEEIEVVKKIIV